MSVQFQPTWEKLVECQVSHFRRGVIFKFKSTHSAGDFYKYALGVKLELKNDLSFVTMDGRTWGYGRCTLPEEARHEGRKLTLSRKWITNNCMHIAKPDDIEDVWVVEDAQGLLMSWDKE